MCEVGATRRSIRIVRLWGLDSSSPRKRTRDNDGTSLREQRNFSLSSVQFVGLKLPSNSHAEIWTRLQAPRSLPITGHRNMPFRHLWNGMFDSHRAEIIVMQFTGHSLPVHHFVTAPWHFYLVPYCQSSCILHNDAQAFHGRMDVLAHQKLHNNWYDLTIFFRN